MRRIPFACLTAFAMMSTPLFADAQTACSILDCKPVSITVSPFASADAFSVQEVWSVVNDILSVSGLAPNFQVVETTEVGNAVAVVIDEERYLAFNPVWMKQYQSDPNAKWQLYAVMAHEVGHHLQGHTLGSEGSRPPTELEADEYAGFTLAALGATLDQAQALWQTLSVQGSSTHPARVDRLAAVKRGFERHKGRSAPTPAAETPNVQKQQPPATQHAVRPNHGPETCARTNVAGTAAQFCVTTTLQAQGGNRYGPDNALDNDASTAWVEGMGGQGIGAHWTYDFAEPVAISRLDFINGYGKSNRTFARNSRVARVHMTTSAGLSARVNFLDIPGWQELNLTELGTITWVSFELLDVFPGTHYTDTALSEFRLQ